MQLRSVLLLLASLALTQSAVANETPKARLVCQCFFDSYSLYISDADGKNEHPLLPGTGSNFNASFSADGHWILFTSDRSGTAHIYRVHPDGTGLEQLTRGRAFDDQGALSADGRTLAFASTRRGGTANIWLLDLATGHTINLTKSRAGNFRPSWSADGQWIAFSSDRDTPLVRYKRPPGVQAWEQMQLTAVYIVRRDGTELRRLTPLDQIAGTAKWSPDGRQLVYYQVSDIEERHEGRGAGHGRIMVVDLQTGATRTASSGGAVFEESPQYLSATEIGYLAFVRESGVETSQLAYSSGRIGAPRSMRSPSWSPDGSSVVYHRLDELPLPWTRIVRPQDPRYELIAGPIFDSPVAFSATRDRFFYASDPAKNGTSVRIRVTNFAGTATRLALVFDTGAPNRPISALALSPDERELAVAIGRSGDRPPLPGEIDLLAVDGSHRRIVAGGPHPNGFPSFSPDGTGIVFRVLEPGDGLRILSLRDGKVRAVTTGWDNFPTWSPRGDLIAFTRFESNAFEIYTIRPDGSDLRQLTHSRGTDAHPVWSPDGQWIAFVSARRGLKDESIFSSSPQPYGEVFVMRADGSDVRQVTDNRFEERILAWLPATPRGHARKVTPHPNRASAR